MNYKNNLKYFKSNDKHFYVGVGILALGALCFFFALIGAYFLPYHEITSVLIALVGAVVAFLPRSLRSNENDIDEIIAEKTRGYEKITAENAGVEHMLSDKITSVTVGDYVYDGEGIICRKGKDDGKCRTTVYTASALVFTNAAIYIAQKTFSLIDDTETETETQFLYEELDAVRAEEEIVYIMGARVKKVFIIFASDREDAMRIPVGHGMNAESFCDDINHQISEIKK